MGNTEKKKQASLTYYVTPDGVVVRGENWASTNFSLANRPARLTACCWASNAACVCGEGRDCVRYCRPRPVAWSPAGARVSSPSRSLDWTVPWNRLFPSVAKHLPNLLGPGTVSGTIFWENPILHLGGTPYLQLSY